MNKLPVAPGDRSVPWRRVFPPTWILKPVKYTCSINRRALPETTDPDTEFRYLDISSVDSEGNWIASEPMRFSEAPSRARRVVAAGDVLVSTVRTYLRAIAHVDKVDDPLICSTGFAVLSANGAVDSKFLAYWARSVYFVDEVVARSVGVSYPAVNASDVGNIPCPLLALNEQRAIVRFLERETARIDALIGKKRRQIEILHEKRAAFISHVVTKGLDPNAPMKDSGIEWLGEIPAHWEVRKIKHLAAKIGSGKTPRGGAEVYVDEGVMLLRSQNIYFDGLRLEDVVFIDHEVDTDMANTRVCPEDVLLNITGASLGRCCLVPQGIGAANVNQHVCIVRPRQEFVVPEYLGAVFASNALQSQIFATENGTSREGLNFEQVGNLWVPVPPDNDEQRSVAYAISTQVQRINTVVGKVNLSIERLREYRTALIAAAVTGKIDVREATA